MWLMQGKIMIPTYWLWLHYLYGWHGPWCDINHSLTLGPSDITGQSRPHISGMLWSHMSEVSGVEELIIGRQVGWRLPEFAECISLKLLDGFPQFEGLWNCPDLKLCNVMVICPFAPYGLAHGPKICQIRHQWGPDFAECISLEPLDRFTPFRVSWNCLDL